MLTIGKLAALTALSVDTIRFYERQDLIRPVTKTDSGYRLYGEDTVRRLRFIRHTQQCGLALGEIRELLELQLRDEPQAVARTLAEKQRLIGEKMSCLRVLSQTLTAIIEMPLHPRLSLDRWPMLAAFEEALGSSKG